MAIFKCKMCGGTLEINNETVAVCQYCGTRQTLPKLDDERKANLYDRANHFRRNNEFDKAMGIYEQILNEDSSDAEAYWSLVLCRYGIEYVEDPASHKRVPTVNRAQFTSVFDDEDYKSALQYADGAQKSIYEQEAAAINEIQKGILAISQQEEPFDVFICYKESDNNGRRTPDSVLATELYHELTREGFKVFFSRITLEDKLGQEYEPYIFAALNSAKVMVVLGTKPEYFNAVWVKNEWSRYLALIKNGTRKMLIPAYKDMDPYDLPEEFSHLQAQDMSKLGFMQDLIRGIKKISGTVEETPTVSKPAPAPSNNISAILDRAFIRLESKEWAKANRLFEDALKINAHVSDAYLGKCMVDLHIDNKDAIVKKGKSVLNNKNFKLALRLAEGSQKESLQSLSNKIKEDTKKRKAKNKKVISKIAIILSCLIVLSSLTYFIGIPFGRYLWYKSLLSDGKIAKATKSYNSSIWFEYKDKVEELFYNKGLKSIEDNQLIDAENLLESIPEYKDSTEKLKEIDVPTKLQKIQKANVGDYVEFGAYEQDGNLKNSFENIEWLVLEKNDTKVLLISKYGLDCVPFSNGDDVPNTSKSNATWETSNLRKWLNNSFYNEAFSDFEKEYIIQTVVENYDYIHQKTGSNFTTESGTVIQGLKTIKVTKNSTNDFLYVLNEVEAEEYFSTSKSRKAKPTQYAKNMGADISYGDGKHAWWWLRTNPDMNWNHSIVSGKGGISINSLPPTCETITVRPVMWINLENIG